MHCRNLFIRRYKDNLSECNGARTKNQFVGKQTLSGLAKWLIVQVETKQLCVKVPLQSVNFEMLCQFGGRSSLTFRLLHNVYFTLKGSCDMIKTFLKIEPWQLLVEFFIVFTKYVSEQEGILEFYTDCIFCFQYFVVCCFLLCYIKKTWKKLF